MPNTSKKTGSLTKVLAGYAAGLDRKVQGRDEFKAGGIKFCVDTCYAFDVQCFETCVLRDGDGGTNVEHYDTEEQAKAGHRRWVASLKVDPKQNLDDLIDYEL